MYLPLFLMLLFFSYVSYAERNKSEMPELPSHLKGIEVDGKTLRHGYIRWPEKEHYYTAMVNPKLAKQGKEVYTKHCLKCHGPDGKGYGPVSKKYGVKAANLLRASKTLTNHAIFIQVAEERGDMPQWMDVLTEDEAWALTHYINTFK